MSDFVPPLDPERIFHPTTKRETDKEWKEMTVESFVTSTGDDLVDDDCSHEPENVTIRSLIKDFSRKGCSSNDRAMCDMCFEVYKSLKKTLEKGKSTNSKVVHPAQTT